MTDPIVITQVAGRWLSEAEAAKHCGVSVTHFKRRFRIRPRDAHGKKVYDRRELDRYMERLQRWATDPASQPPAVKRQRSA